jgi:hypothetical protein
MILDKIVYENRLLLFEVSLFYKILTIFETSDIDESLD